MKQINANYAANGHNYTKNTNEKEYAYTKYQNIYITSVPFQCLVKFSKKIK